MANSTADGSVLIDVDMNVSQAEKRLGKLRGDIENAEKKVADATAARNKAQSKINNSQLDAERKKLEEMTASKKKLAEAESAHIPIAEEISRLESNLSEQQSGRLRMEEHIKKTQEAIISAQKELSLLQESPKDDVDYQKKISELSEFLRVAKPAIGNMQSNLAEYNAEIKRTSLELDRLKEKENSISLGAPQSVASDEAIKKQEEKIKTLKLEWNEAQKAIKKYNSEIAVSNQKLDDLKTEAGILTQEIDEAIRKQNGFGKASAAAEKAMDRLGKRILGLAASALVFNAISAGLRSLQQLTMKYIKTNDEARQAIAQLKGALLTLAQPLIEVIIPAFTLLVNILTRIITAVAQFVSMLFGKTLKQSRDGAKALHKEANAIGEVGEAAEEAAGSLAGFDEINTINTENAKGAGGTGGASDEISPDFGDWGIDDNLLDRLSEIADLVGLIGAGFALWKIGNMLPGILGQIAQLLGGILMTVGGLLLFWNGLTDAWENGVDWLNLIEMIGGLAAAAFGLYTIFELLHPGWGKIAAGIALVVGGLAMLVTGFHDAMENGWNLQNALLSVAGILATGLGIALITGSWIPLLVAGIASVLLALTIATGHGEELINGIREVIEGFKDFFVGIFTGDIEKAVEGLSKIFNGLKTAVFSVINGIKDTLLSFLDWLDEKTGGKFHGIIETAKGIITAGFDFFKNIVGGSIDYVHNVLDGFLDFFAGVFTLDWERAWKGIQKIVEAPIKTILGLFDSVISLAKDVVSSITGVTQKVSRVNVTGSTITKYPRPSSRIDVQSLPSIEPASIPALAQGAVIPPNREFMAVLGDQRSGNNLEAPEDLIRKIVREESGGGSAELVPMLQSILSAIKDGHIIMVDGQTFGRTAIKTINSVNTSAGKQLLKI